MWVSYLAYPNLLGTKGLVVVVVKTDLLQLYKAFSNTCIVRLPVNKLNDLKVKQAKPPEGTRPVYTGLPQELARTSF